MRCSRTTPSASMRRRRWSRGRLVSIRTAIGPTHPTKISTPWAHAILGVSRSPRGGARQAGVHEMRAGLQRERSAAEPGMNGDTPPSHLGAARAARRLAQAWFSGKSGAGATARRSIFFFGRQGARAPCRLPHPPGNARPWGCIDPSSAPSRGEVGPDNPHPITLINGQQPIIKSELCVTTRSSFTSSINAILRTALAFTPPKVVRSRPYAD